MITEVELRKTKEKLQQTTKNFKDKIYPAAVNACSHVALVTFLVRDLKDSLEYNNALVRQVFTQLHKIKKQIEDSQQQIETMFQHSIQPLWQIFHQGVQQQRQENVLQQEQITQLKKEKSIISQMISGANKRVKQLSQKVGY